MWSNVRITAVSCARHLGRLVGHDLLGPPYIKELNVPLVCTSGAIGILELI